MRRVIDATSVGNVAGNALKPSKYDSNTNNEKQNEGRLTCAGRRD